MKKILIFGLMALMVIGMVSAEYKGEFTAGTYLDGDTVLWETNCYSANGNLGNIPETYNPTSAWSSFWIQVDMNNCNAVTTTTTSTTTTTLQEGVWGVGAYYEVGDEVLYNDVTYTCISPHTSQSDWTPDVAVSLWQGAAQLNPGDTWQAGHSYSIGDEVIYGGITYKVRQAHTSQSDWSPDKVLALFKPVITSSQMYYYPPEANEEPTTYASYTQSELSELMTFSYIGAEIKDDGVHYSWSYAKPELDTTGDVKWIVKPVSVILNYDLIADCSNEYSGATCLNILVYGTDSSLINNQTVTSVKSTAQSIANTEVQNAIAFQDELLNTLDVTSYLINSLDITPGN
jgi:hypothetical protein